MPKGANLKRSKKTTRLSRASWTSNLLTGIIVIAQDLVIVFVTGRTEMAVLCIIEVAGDVRLSA